jgi:hypothetical protein
MSKNRKNLSLSANVFRLNLGTRSAAVPASLDKGTHQAHGVRPSHPRMRVAPVDAGIWEFMESISIWDCMDTPRFSESSGFRYRPGPARAGVESEASRRVPAVVPGVVPVECLTPPSLPGTLTFCPTGTATSQPKLKAGWQPAPWSRRATKAPAAWLWTQNPAPDPAALQAAGG